MAPEEGSGTAETGGIVPGAVVSTIGGCPAGISTGPTGGGAGEGCIGGGRGEGWAGGARGKSILASGGMRLTGGTTGTAFDAATGAARGKAIGASVGGVAVSVGNVIAAPPTRAALPTGPSASGSFRHTSRTIVMGDFGATWTATGRAAAWPTPCPRKCRTGWSTLRATCCVMVQHWVMLKGHSGILPVLAASLAHPSHVTGEHFGAGTHGGRLAQRRNELLI